MRCSSPDLASRKSRRRRGRLQLAESEQILAQQNYNRSKQLVAQKAISQAEFDAALEQFDAAQALGLVRKQELELLLAGTREEEKREAKARVDEAEQGWNLVKNGYRSEEIAKAKAARDAAQAALDVIREQKKELVITCPIDGVIEALDLQKGDLVPAGAPVLSVMDDRHLWIRAYVPQNRVGLQVGQKLRVTVDSFPKEHFQGELTFISRQAEFTPSNVQTPEERSKQVFRIKLALAAGPHQAAARHDSRCLARSPESIAMNDVVMEAKSLTRRFGDFVAVRDVSFQVARGSIFGLLGPNGSGKSTIIRMLLGILPPTSGSAMMLGRDAYLESESIKPRVGYMSQQFSLYADLSVRENIQFYGRVYGLDSERLQRRMNEVLELTSMQNLCRPACRHAVGRLAAAAGPGMCAGA